MQTTGYYMYKLCYYQHQAQKQSIENLQLHINQPKIVVQALKSLLSLTLSAYSNLSKNYYI